MPNRQIFDYEQLNIQEEQMQIPPVLHNNYQTLYVEARPMIPQNINRSNTNRILHDAFGRNVIFFWSVLICFVSLYISIYQQNTYDSVCGINCDTYQATVTNCLIKNSSYVFPHVADVNDDIKNIPYIDVVAIYSYYLQNDVNNHIHSCTHKTRFSNDAEAIEYSNSIIGSYAEIRVGNPQIISNQVCYLNNICCEQSQLTYFASILTHFLIVLVILFCFVLVFSFICLSDRDITQEYFVKINIRCILIITYIFTAISIPFLMMYIVVNNN